MQSMEDDVERSVPCLMIEDRLCKLQDKTKQDKQIKKHVVGLSEIKVELKDHDKHENDNDDNKDEEADDDRKS